MRISVSKAIDLLLQGQVVALPTETVYGLAACMAQPKAVSCIYSLKNRPSDNPLIIHVSCLDQLHEIAEKIPDSCQALIEHFWPGPLTFILPAKKESVPEIVRANLPNIAVRMPNHPLMVEILNHTGPLVAPSANLSGKPSSTSPEHVEEDFGKDFPVVDGGVSSKGVESTILFVEGERWSIARLGAISPEELAAVLGYKPTIKSKDSSSPICPGQHYKHYSPQAKLFMLSSYEGHPPIVMGFKERQYPNAQKVFYLSSLENPQEALHHLYHLLRDLDHQNIKEIWVDFDFPREGLFLTLAERLQRAANLGM